jgi:ATP-dependent DNA ligase
LGTEVLWSTFRPPRIAAYAALGGLLLLRHLHQNSGGTVRLFYYAFDLMIFAGKDVMNEPLTARRALLKERVLSKLDEPIRESPELEASLPELTRAVKAQSLEGLVAKRRDSRYEAGERSGAWQKMRVNRGQEFVIAGYTVAGNAFDAIVFGYYDEGKLLYAGRTRNGFTPASRNQLLKRFAALAEDKCPFANLPETKSGRWGAGLTAEKMKDCHNVECRTMPNRSLPLLSFLRSASFRFGIIRLRIRQRNRAPFAHVSKR